MFSLGGAVFVDRPVSEMEKNGPGDEFFVMEGAHHQAVALGKEMGPELLEEGIGLGRQAMPLAGHAIESIEPGQCLYRSFERYLHGLLLGIPNIPPGALAQPPKDFDFAFGEVKGVMIVVG